MNVASPSAGVGYAGLYIGAAGIYPLIPLTISITGALVVSGPADSPGNNIGGSTKRAVGMGLINSIGNAGGIISSFIYRAQDKPRYTLGHSVVIAFIAMNISASPLDRAR